LISDASHTLGQGISSVFARAGATVVAMNCPDDAVQYARLFSRIADTGSFAQVEAAVADILLEFGQIDILINCGGLPSNDSIGEIGGWEWLSALRSALYSAFYFSRPVAAHMAERHSGVILNISSGAADSGVGEGVQWCAAHAALNGLMRAMARELAPLGIRVNSIAPAYIENMAEDVSAVMPVRRMGTPEDVGQLAAYLASPMAGFLHSQVVTLDGGYVYR
jgi:3-oxoacyl-[acyl-carrier protein] reductase